MDDRAPDLLSRARAGDRDALSALLAAHAPALRRKVRIPAAYRRALDPDDVLQVTYVEAFLRIGECRAGDERAFLAWLGAIVGHNLTDAIRELGRRKRPDPRRALATDERPDGGPDRRLEALLEWSRTPSRDAAQREAVAELERALSALPEDYETVVRLFDIEGRSAGEVARRMGRSKGAIHMIRLRARDRLRAVLARTDPFPSGTRPVDPGRGEAL